MKQILVKEIIKSDNRIEVCFEKRHLDDVLYNGNFYWEYDVNIEQVPESIAVIPFVANLLPLVFVLDVQLVIDELDADFYNCISEYRSAYKQMIHCIEFKGEILAKRVIENSYSTGKSCLLFSGGIDAMNSLVKNEDNIIDCITIWGADIRHNNIQGWNVMRHTIETTLNKYNKNLLCIKSNFRELLNETELYKYVEKSHDSWWHGYQHGIAIIGQVAPLAYINHYEKIYIASSFTENCRPICASDPMTDNCFKCGSTTTVHDGFEFDRCQKINNIFESLDRKKVSVDLHVCWEASSGENCGRCEKCVRSYLNCRVVNRNPQRIGITPKISIRKIKKMYLHKFNFEESDVLRAYLESNIENLKLTYGNQIPKDLMWLARINPQNVNNTLYWKLKKQYKRIKRILYG